MNAPAKVAPARDRFMPMLSAIMPDCPADQVETRCSLLMLRKRANDWLRCGAGEAMEVVLCADRLATRCAGQSMSTRDIKRARATVLQLLRTATEINTLTSDLRGEPEGETDGRG